jgi:hypothetical protein
MAVIALFPLDLGAATPDLLQHPRGMDVHVVSRDPNSVAISAAGRRCTGRPSTHAQAVGEVVARTRGRTTSRFPAIRASKWSRPRDGAPHRAYADRNLISTTIIIRQLCPHGPGRVSGWGPSRARHSAALSLFPQAS